MKGKMNGDSSCCGSICTKCRGASKLVLGILFIGWAYGFPNLDWRLGIGILLIIAGIVVLSYMGNTGNVINIKYS